MISPYTKQLIVLPDPIDTQRQTKTGIHIAESYTKREDMTVHMRWGKVVAVGAECHEKIKEGSRVCYNPFNAFEVVDQHVPYDVVHTDGVHGVLTT